MRSKLLLLLCGLAFLHSSPASAQTGTGRISGTVKDATGAVVPGVTITAVHEETGVQQHTVTTEAGLFVFPSLPVGPYTVKAELSGFRGVTRAKNILSVGADLNLTFDLQPGNLEESVTVTSDSPMVQTTESSLS